MLTVKTCISNNVSIVNHHFDLNSPKNLNYVNLRLTEQFYNERVNNSLMFKGGNYLSYDQDLYNFEIENNYLFSFIRNIPFTDFFKTHQIDVPRCFIKTKSLKRQQDITNIIKFSTYIMIKGFKLKVINKLIKSFSSNLNLINSNNVDFFWKNLYVYFNLNQCKLVRYTKFYIHQPDKNFDESSFHNLTDFAPNYTFNKTFFNKLKIYEPLFLFYIYKVDKSIFKNSRGKSGKFTFIWKYITPYKRSLIIYHWLNKELKTVNKRTLQERLNFLVNQVIINPKTTWIYRIRKFSYNYVYYNCKNTLARTYRTTTR